MTCELARTRSPRKPPCPSGLLTAGAFVIASEPRQPAAVDTTLPGAALSAAPNGLICRPCGDGARQLRDANIRQGRNYLGRAGRFGDARLPEVVISLRKLRYRAGSAGLSHGLLRAPQKPHKPATRWPLPTGIPRTERHTPVHLLCVLKGTENSQSPA
jgi:hypothetical protein